MEFLVYTTLHTLFFLLGLWLGGKLENIPKWEELTEKQKEIYKQKALWLMTTNEIAEALHESKRNKL